MKKPILSIIIPVYNAEPYLSKCIDSILNQTFKSFELILIDDGSPDKSGIICDKYAEKDARVKVIHKTNGGPAQARNIGIKCARGEWIGFVDADDYIDVNMYSRLVETGLDKNAEVVICNYYKESDGNIKKLKHSIPQNIVLDKESIRVNIISKYYSDDAIGIPSLFNKIYRKKFIEKNNLLIDEKRIRAEDYWFNMDVYKRAERVVAIEDALYYYKQINKDSVTRTYRENQYELSVLTRKKLIDLNREFRFDINYNKFNRKFILETSSYIIQIIRKCSSREMARIKVTEILSSEVYQEAIRRCDELPIYIKIINLLVKNKMYRIAYLCYQILSLIKMMYGRKM